MRENRYRYGSSTNRRELARTRYFSVPGILYFCPKGLFWYCAGSWKICVRQVFVHSFVSGMFGVPPSKQLDMFALCKFSLILLRKWFGRVTHRPLSDPKFGRFTNDKAYISDQKWTPKIYCFRIARRATLPCGYNLIIVWFSDVTSDSILVQ